MKLIQLVNCHHYDNHVRSIKMSNSVYIYVGREIDGEKYSFEFMHGVGTGCYRRWFTAAWGVH